ncbi:putative dynein ATPase [Helianthus annuus]|nr:putative dynein ATPase [Helianthus annuus]
MIKILCCLQKFDCLYGPAWHCIVGTSFGSYVTHSSGCFFVFFDRQSPCSSL